SKRGSKPCALCASERPKPRDVVWFSYLVEYLSCGVARASFAQLERLTQYGAPALRSLASLSRDEGKDILPEVPQSRREIVGADGRIDRLRRQHGGELL